MLRQLPMLAHGRVVGHCCESGDVGHGSQLLACHAYSVTTAFGLFFNVRSNSDT